MSKTAGMFNIQKSVKPKNNITKKEDGEIIVRVKKESDSKHVKYSDDDIAKLLKDYKSIPSTAWGSLSYGTHIRYVRTDGRFVRGGFVSGYIKSNDKTLINISNGFNASIKGYSAWSIALDSIKYIYVKSSVNVTLTKPEENGDLKNIVAKLQKRIKILESKKH